MNETTEKLIAGFRRQDEIDAYRAAARHYRFNENRTSREDTIRSRQAFIEGWLARQEYDRD